MYDKSMPFEATIKWIKKETRDTFTSALKIKSREMQRAYRFVPGQFNMLYVPGIGEAPISISSSPLDHDLMHTVRVAGDVTTALSGLRAGDVIGMRGPFGKGWPLEETEDRDLLIVAGGLGIAPLRSVARHILRSPAPKKRGSAHPRRMLASVMRVRCEAVNSHTYAKPRASSRPIWSMPLRPEATTVAEARFMLLKGTRSRVPGLSAT